MSRVFFLLFILSTILVNESRAQLYLGARTGINYSNIAGIHPHSQPRIGFQFGVHSFFRLADDDKWFLQPEITYSTQGEFDRPNAPAGAIIKQRLFLDYLRIPFFLKWYSTEMKYRIFFEAGPYIGYRVNKKVDLYSFSTLADDHIYNKIDAGGVFGVGFSLNKEWEMSLRYSLGILKQIENPEVSGRALNSIVNLGVSYSINVTKERWFQARCKF